MDQLVPFAVPDVCANDRATDDNRRQPSDSAEPDLAPRLPGDNSQHKRRVVRHVGLIAVAAILCCMAALSVFNVFSFAPPPKEAHIAQVIRKLGGDVVFDQESGAIETVMLNPDWNDVRPCTDEQLKLAVDDLQKCTSLHGVWIIKNRITNSGLEHLGRLHAVRELRIYQSRTITDDGLLHLRGLKNVEKMDLHILNIRGRGLQHLTSLRALKSLSLHNTFCGDEGMPHIGKMKQLESLDLGNTNITDKGLVHLGGLTKLEELFLGSTKVTDKGIAHLTALRNLRSLSLPRGKGITDASLEHLKRLTRLETIYLPLIGVDETGITEKGVSELKAALPKLKIE